MPDFSVILPAAGSSTRFGGSVSKLFLDLAGQPVLTRTLRQFARRDDVREIIVAAFDRQAVGQCVAKLESPFRGKIKICDGGTCRAGSVQMGLLAGSREIEWVAVHDAARPLVPQDVIDRTFAAAVQHGAAAAALPAHLTIKQAIGPLPAPVQRTLPRDQLWAMQTPQAMRRADLADAFATCPIPLDQITDDVQLLEIAGKLVWLVPGDEKNLKITTPLDLQIAQTLLDS
jgi:2-C-methyl-D-erythritol 4-phosphate cytidylyltransferase